MLKLHFDNGEFLEFEQTGDANERFADSMMVLVKCVRTLVEEDKKEDVFFYCHALSTVLTEKGWNLLLGDLPRPEKYIVECANESQS